MQVAEAICVFDFKRSNEMKINKIIVLLSFGMIGVGRLSAKPNSASLPVLQSELNSILNGSVLYIAGTSGTDFFQINDISMDTSVNLVFPFGADLYYTSGKESQAPRGYNKNGLFVTLDLKATFHLNDIFVYNDTVLTVGSDVDTVDRPSLAFKFVNQKKTYLPSLKGETYCVARKVFYKNDTTWILGNCGGKTVVWMNDSLLVDSELSATRASDFGNFEKYRQSILIAGNESHFILGQGIVGGWYWHQNKKTSIKYYEDGVDSVPTDMLHVYQFVVCGDSLVAVGLTPFISAPSYLWVNGVATPWEDSTVEGEKLLSVAQNKGVIYLLGEYKKADKIILCIWSQGKRIDLRDVTSYTSIRSFKIVDPPSMALIDGKLPALIAHKTIRQATGLIKGKKIFLENPKSLRPTATTVDGKNVKISSPLPRP
jgi:hypothetical protein